MTLILGVISALVGLAGIGGKAWTYFRPTSAQETLDATQNRVVVDDQIERMSDDAVRRELRDRWTRG